MTLNKTLRRNDRQPERQPRVTPAIYTALLDRLTVVNRHMIVWIGWVLSIPQI